MMEGGAEDGGGVGTDGRAPWVSFSFRRVRDPTYPVAGRLFWRWKAWTAFWVRKPKKSVVGVVGARNPSRFRISWRLRTSVCRMPRKRWIVGAGVRVTMGADGGVTVGGTAVGGGVVAGGGVYALPLPEPPPPPPPDGGGVGA